MLLKDWHHSEDLSCVWGMLSIEQWQNRGTVPNMQFETARVKRRLNSLRLFSEKLRIKTSACIISLANMLFICGDEAAFKQE